MPVSVRDKVNQARVYLESTSRSWIIHEMLAQKPGRKCDEQFLELK